MIITKSERLEADQAIEPILFFRGDDPEWGFMSSFSYTPIVMPHPWRWPLELATYDTREHRFQACKAVDADAHEFVRTAPSPGISKGRGRSIELREDWGCNQGDVCWLVMVESIFAVCIQHPLIAQTLKATEARMIYEDSPTDDLWGWRSRNNYNGKNLLGLAWMHVRGVLNGWDATAH